MAHSSFSTAPLATERRRFLKNLALAAVAVQVPGLASCETSHRLVIALHLWVGYETLYLARDFKWLPASISIRDDATLVDSLAALKCGAAHAAAMTLDEMLRARATGIPLSAALVLDVSAGADMVLARSNITSLSDLTNKRIGFDPTAVGALVFEKLLEASKLPPASIIQVDLPPARQLDAWRRNEVDAVITYEPMASLLMHEGARNLFDSREMPDTVIDVLVVRTDYPPSLPLLRTLISCHFRAIEHIRRNEQDAILRIAARESLSPEDVRLALAGIALPSLASNGSYLRGDNPGLARAADVLAKLMVRRGLLPREDKLDYLILPGALPDDGMR